MIICLETRHITKFLFLKIHFPICKDNQFHLIYLVIYLIMFLLHITSYGTHLTPS